MVKDLHLVLPSTDLELEFVAGSQSKKKRTQISQKNEMFFLYNRIELNEEICCVKMGVLLMNKNQLYKNYIFIHLTHTYLQVKKEKNKDNSIFMTFVAPLESIN